LPVYLYILKICNEECFLCIKKRVLRGKNKDIGRVRGYKKAKKGGFRGF